MNAICTHRFYTEFTDKTGAYLTHRFLFEDGIVKELALPIAYPDFQIGEKISGGIDEWGDYYLNAVKQTGQPFEKLFLE